MKKEYLKNLSKLILQKIEEGNYTITRFADEAGVCSKTISNILSMKSSVTLDIAEKICEVHEISWIDVLGLQEELDKKTLDRIMLEFVLTDGKNNYKISPNLIKHNRN